jgi:hypothetical protein
MENTLNEQWRSNMVRMVFGFILCSFIFRYYNHVLLHQLLQPVIFKTEADLAYWLYHIAGVGQLIVQQATGALIFDSLLVSLCLTTIVYPFQRFTPIAFSLLYPLYFLSYNAYVTHHTGTMDGILLISFAFWNRKQPGFSMVWDALRYFTLSVYFMAFFWKVFIGGSVFHISQPEAIVKDNLALYLYLNPGSIFSGVIYWFLNHPLVLYLGYTACILLQGFMATGFFTRRYDAWLCGLAILFHLSTYFFVDVCYFELLIINFTFIPAGSFTGLMRIFKQSTPSMNKAGIHE